MPAQPEKLPSPAWHKKILEKRLAKIEAGKGKFLTLAQLKKRLAKRA
jgi:Putative addiction module component